MHKLVITTCQSVHAHSYVTHITPSLTHAHTLHSNFKLCKRSTFLLSLVLHCVFVLHVCGVYVFVSLLTVTASHSLTFTLTLTLTLTFPSPPESCVSVSSDAPSQNATCELMDNTENIFGAFGIHPLYASMCFRNQIYPFCCCCHCTSSFFLIILFS